MGYGFYEIDGQPAGYAVEDVCNLEDCRSIINRGTAYACGGEPGAGEDYCAGFFCGAHLTYSEKEWSTPGPRCRSCSLDPASSQIEETRPPAPIIHYAEEDPLETFSIRSFDVAPDGISVSIESPTVVGAVFEALVDLLRDAPNFLAVEVEISPAETAEAFSIIVQRKDGKTPAAELAELRAEVEELRSLALLPIPAESAEEWLEEISAVLVDFTKLLDENEGDPIEEWTVDVRLRLLAAAYDLYDLTKGDGDSTDVQTDLRFAADIVEERIAAEIAALKETPPTPE